jgi:hypothetical protein
MTVLYENLQRAKKARRAIMVAAVWTLGWLYWAYALNSGGSRLGVVILVIAVGLAPLVALHFYSSVYVVRVVREGDMLTVTTLGLWANRNVRLPVNAVIDVDRPEAGGMTMRVAGRKMPFILDLHAEYGDLNAISALAKHDTKRMP